MKSFLRWAGSKLQLLPTLSEYWTDDVSRYVEPFCGSASLFFALEPASAVLSDLNAELIETLQRVQLSADGVASCLMRLGRAESTYYRVRAENPMDLAPDQRAARFIYLNGLCFNGLYRVNMLGRFNVPFGSKHREALFTPEGLRQASYALRRADIRHSDFEPIVDRTRESDFVYLDPPYATGSRRTFLEYGRQVFCNKDLKRLIEALKRADKRGVRFLLSYADVPEIRNAPRCWRIQRVKTRRNIAGFLSSRRTVSEVLVSNMR